MILTTTLFSSQQVLALKMVLCNEVETSASSTLHSVHTQTRSNLEDCDSDV